MTWTRIALALLIELVLGTFALFGGPHGIFGAWSWLLQMPGMLLMFVPPADTWMPFRLVLVVVVQTLLWFGALTLLARARSRRVAT